MLRLKVERLAVKPLSLRDATLHFTEQPQPVEHLSHWLVLLQITLAGSSRLDCLALVCQAGNGSQQRGTVGVAGCCSRFAAGANAVAFRDAGWAAGVRGVGSGVGRAIGLFTGAGAVAVAAVSRGA